MVEFALVLPIILLLLFGVIQFGIAFNHYLALTDAVRAGARKGAVARHLAGSREAYVEAEVEKAASDLKKEKLDVQVVSSWKHGEDVVVTAKYPYSISLLGMVVKSGDLTSSTTERVD